MKGRLRLGREARGVGFRISRGFWLVHQDDIVNTAEQSDNALTLWRVAQHGSWPKSVFPDEPEVIWTPEKIEEEMEAIRQADRAHRIRCTVQRRARQKAVPKPRPVAPPPPPPAPPPKPPVRTSRLQRLKEWVRAMEATPYEGPVCPSCGRDPLLHMRKAWTCAWCDVELVVVGSRSDPIRYELPR